MHASFEARADALYDRAGKLSSTMDEVVGCNCEDIIHVSQICDVAFILPCKVIDEGHLQISPKGMCRLLVQRIKVLEHEIDVCYKFQVCFPYFIFRWWWRTRTWHCVSQHELDSFCLFFFSKLGELCFVGYKWQYGFVIKGVWFISEAAIWWNSSYCPRIAASFDDERIYTDTPSLIKAAQFVHRCVEVFAHKIRFRSS